MHTPYQFFLGETGVDPLTGGLTALTVLVAVYVLNHVITHLHNSNITEES